MARPLKEENKRVRFTQTTVRPFTKAKLEEIAEEYGVSMGDLLDDVAVFFQAKQYKLKGGK